MSDPQKSYHLEFVCTDEDKARQLQSVIPVSYTHLDVYKRQVHAVIDGDKANATLTQDFHNLTDFQIVTTHAAHVLSLIHI